MLETISLCEKKSSVSFENAMNKMCLEIRYLIYMYKDIATHCPSG